MQGSSPRLLMARQSQSGGWALLHGPACLTDELQRVSTGEMNEPVGRGVGFMDGHGHGHEWKRGTGGAGRGTVRARARHDELDLPRCHGSPLAGLLMGPALAHEHLPGGRGAVFHRRDDARLGGAVFQYAAADRQSRGDAHRARAWRERGQQRGAAGEGGGERQLHPWHRIGAVLLGGPHPRQHLGDVRRAHVLAGAPGGGADGPGAPGGARVEPGHALLR